MLNARQRLRSARMRMNVNAVAWLDSIVVQFHAHCALGVCKRNSQESSIDAKNHVHGLVKWANMRFCYHFACSMHRLLFSVVYLRYFSCRIIIKWIHRLRLRWHYWNDMPQKIQWMKLANKWHSVARMGSEVVREGTKKMVSRDAQVFFFSKRLIARILDSILLAYRTPHGTAKCTWREAPYKVLWTTLDQRRRWR